MAGWPATATATARVAVDWVAAHRVDESEEGTAMEKSLAVEAVLAGWPATECASAETGGVGVNEKAQLMVSAGVAQMAAAASVAAVTSARPAMAAVTAAPHQIQRGSWVGSAAVESSPV